MVVAVLSLELLGDIVLRRARFVSLSDCSVGEEPVSFLQISLLRVCCKQDFSGNH